MDVVAQSETQTNAPTMKQTPWLMEKLLIDILDHLRIHTLKFGEIL